MCDFEELLQHNVETEYSSFKTEMLNASSDEVFEHAGKIHFYIEIYNYILNNSLIDIFSKLELVRLVNYKKHLITCLFDEYLKYEHLAINTWDAVKEIFDSLLSHISPIVTPIKTEIWENDPDKKGLLRYVGQRKVVDVYAEVCELLLSENIMPDEYLLIGNNFDKPNMDIPQIENIICYAQWGGSEGVYLHVDIVVKNYEHNRYEPMNFIVGKTLGEPTEDFDQMQRIAGRIYRAFTGDGHTSERYVKAPD